MNLTKPRLDQFKITGSTVGDVYFPQTKLLLPFDGSNGATSTTDESNSNLSLTIQGSSTISTAQSKFGGSSLYVPNSNPAGVYSSGAGSTIQLTADFTVEWWVYRTQVSLSDDMMIGPLYGMTSPSAPGSTATLFGYYYAATSATEALLYSSSHGSSWDIANAVALGAGSLGTVGQWVHMAMTRSSTTWNFYVDGTRTYTGSLGSATLVALGGYIILGKGWNNASSMQAYYDDFRITQGQARYTGASFTVPATAHLTSAGDVNKHIVVNSDADGVAIGTGGINQARIVKAWANIDGSQTAASMIQSSYNISSMTDHGTGIYSFNFSTAMTDAHYTVTTGIGSVVDGAQSIPELLIQNQTTALVKLNARYSTGASTQADYDYNTCCMTVFGN
mgnify:FL=1